MDGPWPAFDSNTAQGRLWLAGEGPRGAWWLRTDHPGIAQEFDSGQNVSPELAAWCFSDKADLYAALDQVYQLGVSLPDAPLGHFV